MSQLETKVYTHLTVGLPIGTPGGQVTWWRQTGDPINNTFEKATGLISRQHTS